MKTVLTWLVKFDLDMMTEAVFRINYGVMLGCERSSSRELEMIGDANVDLNRHYGNEDCFPLLDEPLFIQLWTASLEDPESDPDVRDRGIKRWRVDCLRSISALLLPSRRTGELAPGSAATEWKNDWNLFFLVTLLRNSIPYIERDMDRQKDHPSFQGALDLKSSVDRYIYRTFQTAGPFHQLSVDFQYEDSNRLANAILMVLLEVSQVSCVPWSAVSILGSIDATSLPPISSPAAKTLSNIAWIELEATFIESGWFKFRTTVLLDQHLTFDAASSTIMIFNDFEGLRDGLKEFNRNYLAKCVPV
jgi:hypothetical protein